MSELELCELPAIAREIVSVIGFEDTLRIVNIYGGMTIAFTDETRGEIGTRRDIIARMLGRTKAKAFFRHFANRSLYIPRCASALKNVRNKEICRDSDTLSMQELIAKWNMSERHIWRILKESADKA